METFNPDMSKLINFLKNHGYEFKNIEYKPRFEDSARVIFEKNRKY